MEFLVHSLSTKYFRKKKCSHEIFWIVEIKRENLEKIFLDLNYHNFRIYQSQKLQLNISIFLEKYFFLFLLKKLIPEKNFNISILKYKRFEKKRKVLTEIKTLSSDIVIFKDIFQFKIEPAFCFFQLFQKFSILNF